MADVEPQTAVEEVPQAEAAHAEAEAPPQEQPAEVAEQPAEAQPAAAEEVAAEGAEQPAPQAAEPTITGDEPAPVDASAAAAAAAAIAARLTQQQGDQYPVSSGAEHAEGNNKRPREDDPLGDGDGGPEKKRASTGALENGGDNPVGVPRQRWQSPLEAAALGP
jgi:hypothetical protein